MKHLLILTALTTSFLVSGCHRQNGNSQAGAEIKASGQTILLPEGSRQASSVNVEVAQRCDSSLAHLNGRLMWNEDVTSRVFTPFAGRVIKITTEVGRVVHKGDPLAEIASPEYGQAQADYRKAISALQLAQRNLTRTRDLFSHGAAPQKDLYSAESDFETAQSEVERTSARLTLYLGNTNSVDQIFVVRSPLDGVVVEKNVNPGQEVRADAMLAQDPRLFAPLFVVTDPRRLWIQLEASEMDLSKLQTGQEILVRAQAFPSLTFSGKVDVIGDALDQVKRIINVRGSVDNPERLLKAEMFVEADVPMSPHTAAGADVPRGAVFGKLGEKGYVFVEVGPGHYERREVKVGFEHDGQVFLEAGVEPGQRVVTEGCLLLNKLLQDAAGS